MDVKRSTALCLLLLIVVLQITSAKKHYKITQENVELTYDHSYGSGKIFIKNNKLNAFANMTKPVPTNANVVLKAFHMNPKGKYDAVGIPWTINACSYMENDKVLYGALAKLSNMHIPKKCPVLADRYYFTDYDLNQINIPVAIPLGKYKGDLKVLSGRNEIIHLLWYGTITKE